MFSVEVMGENVMFPLYRGRGKWVRHTREPRVCLSGPSLADGWTRNTPAWSLVGSRHPDSEATVAHSHGGGWTLGAGRGSGVGLDPRPGVGAPVYAEPPASVSS